ncbi:MAG TPA: hypothetical protein VFH74_05615 [Gaiellales bacterium]|nr:hypothetical protein [Gaiellales bacterium]
MTGTTLRSWIVTGALAAGAAVGAAAVANAATGGSSTGSTQGSVPSFVANGAPGQPPGPGGPGHGPGETLLTGSAASKAKAAALAAVPGATVLRAETDSGPAAYEAHMRKSDGSMVTVKLDSSFHVTAVQNGMGAGPHGTPPAGAPKGAPTGAA